MNRGVLSFCSLALAAGLLLAPTAEAGFHRAKIGMVIANIELPALSGDRQPLLGDAAVNVFVFFKPGQEHSRTTLAQMAKIAKNSFTRAGSRKPSQMFGQA